MHNYTNTRALLCPLCNEESTDWPPPSAGWQEIYCHYCDKTFLGIANEDNTCSSKTKPKLIMLVGLPGSGKSTLAKQLSLAYGATIHSSDQIRQALYGNASTQRNHKRVFSTLHARIKEDLHQGLTTIYDATNISYKRRMTFLDEIKDLHAEKECILLVKPYTECVKDATNRGYSFSPHVILRMLQTIHIPQYYEGWDYIKLEDTSHYTNWKSRLGQDVVGDYMDYHLHLPHHPLTLGQHLQKTHEKIISLWQKAHPEIPPLVALKEAALYHDIAKPLVCTLNSDTGIATYHGHANASAYEYLTLRPVFAPSVHILQVANLIQWHQRPCQLQTASPKAIQKFINLVGQETFNNLLILNQADINAH